MHRRPEWHSYSRTSPKAIHAAAHSLDVGALVELCEPHLMQAGLSRPGRGEASRLVFGEFIERGVPPAAPHRWPLAISRRPSTLRGAVAIWLNATGENPMAKFTAIIAGLRKEERKLQKQLSAIKAAISSLEFGSGGGVPPLPKRRSRRVTRAATGRSHSRRKMTRLRKRRPRPATHS